MLFLVNNTADPQLLTNAVFSVLTTRY